VTELFFTADTHFGHRAMIENGWRPQFSTVEEMDEALIERWNLMVGPRDTVWHLGDFGMGGQAKFLPLVPKLHGTIHLITGNHDNPWPGGRQSFKFQSAWLAAGFASVQAYARRNIGGQQVMLSHFPYAGDHVGEDRAAQYRLRDLGLPLLHGHVHSEWKTRGRQINVGVDVWDFTPLHLSSVETLVKRVMS
jgi:calcineurin-like phosphoesterase family protein